MKGYKQQLINMTYIPLFAVFIAVCSWITVPLTVPVTLQTLAVFVTAGLLGTRRGVLAVLLYILLGAAGIPVFSNFNSGISYILGQTGGYIIGFVFSAAAIGIITGRFGKSPRVMIIAMVTGLLVCYIFGTAWFYAVYTHNTGPVGIFTVLMWCVIPFVIPDIVKILIAILIIERVGKYVK
ncbi:MAG TPA: biotin transporter BioY [Clostridiales bacterium]|nr:biotin transporter BioY [Clostridiales bacterium]